MLSVILPANNEAPLIGRCLQGVLASGGPAQCEVVVVANGCSDDTAEIARSYQEKFAARGWDLRVLDLEEGGKIGALNAGDAAAKGNMRVYLDADVEVGPKLLEKLANALSRKEATYASGRLVIARARSRVSRAYGRAYREVPFIREGVPGAGVFAVNEEGRKRWGLFPDIISDDTFVRLQFAPQERLLVDASYEWPIVEGWKNLVKVRRRQNQGVAEIRANYPELLVNDDTRPLGLGGALSLAIRAPFAFAVYVAVALTVKLTATEKDGWSRGR